MFKYIAFSLLLIGNSIAISGEIAKNFDRSITSKIISDQNYLKSYKAPFYYGVKTKPEKALKIDKNPELKNYICTKLKEKWSPLTIAERWNKKDKNIKICSQAIYEWIYKNNFHLFLRYKGKRRIKKSLYNYITHYHHKEPKIQQVTKHSTIEYSQKDLQLEKKNESQTLSSLITALKKLISNINHIS